MIRSNREKSNIAFAILEKEDNNKIAPQFSHNLGAPILFSLPLW